MGQSSRTTEGCSYTVPSDSSETLSSGKCCFICGAPPKSVEFNDEHVIPDWIIRRHGLSGERLISPDGSTQAYSRNKISCCRACNSRLGEQFERPIQELFATGYSAVADSARRFGPSFLLQWLSLIFLKTHLRDYRLRHNPDPRAGDLRTVGDLHPNIEKLRHIHHIARAHYTGAEITPSAWGSLFIIPAQTEGIGEPFDYADLSRPLAIMIRIGPTCLIACLADGCSALNLSTHSRRIRHPLTPPQARELLAHIALVPMSLKSPPEFFSTFSATGRLLIVGRPPATRELLQMPPEIRGRIIIRCLRGYFPETISDSEAREIADGRRSFLFDMSGDHIAPGGSLITQDAENLATHASVAPTIVTRRSSSSPASSGARRRRWQ
jgi:hypothetical protein